ncbi:uncharacterized protein LOC143191191 isoform X1 [Rhynchophorus ferrugineus]|uniref:uncharacterized protein LOC143191191 isoform X1 n=1 Tax=Rhynchophorus ferrugineus TaxID=354439 RepID=UPI003FCED4EF
MASEQFSLCWDNFHKNMSSGMNSLLENEDLVDVTLAVEGKLLKAHKMVLSVCSPYFKELFKSNPCQHPIVFMKDVSYVAISDLLQFMYQGEVQVSQDNLTTFIKTAEALQIKGLTGDGNGSTDVEPEQPQERSFNRHSEETYKPASRPKKPLPNPIVTTTSTKRPRLSVSSNDSQSAAPPSQPLTKTEPGTTLSDNSSQPVQFKMEPYDQNQSVTIPDDTGDENFGDDTLEDTAVDDTEDYSMMEGEEPQAGTSTDGAAEGQVMTKRHNPYAYKRPNIPLKRLGIIDLGDGHLYRNCKKLSDKMYLKCSMFKEVNCKASYVAYLDNDGHPYQYKCVVNHNHPSNEFTLQSVRFLKALQEAVKTLPGSTKNIFDCVISSYPEIKEVYTYNNVVGRMHHWLKKYNVHGKSRRPQARVNSLQEK